jgi:hypothetical protein
MYRTCQQSLIFNICACMVLQFRMGLGSVEFEKSSNYRIPKIVIWGNEQDAYVF